MVGFQTLHLPEIRSGNQGKIESVIRYAKRGFLPGRSFDDLADLETQWQRWLQEVGDAKPHETKGRVPQEAWQEEKKELQPLCPGPFQVQPAFRTQQVYQDGFVKVLGNRYSVPVSHHGRQVKVRVTEEKVELRGLEGEFLCNHWRSLEKGRRFKIDTHYEKNYQAPTEQLTAAPTTCYP